MTIEEKIRHAHKYGYPVRVTFDGCSSEGMVTEILDNSIHDFSLSNAGDGATGRYNYTNIISVESCVWTPPIDIDESRRPHIRVVLGWLKDVDAREDLIGVLVDMGLVERVGTSVAFARITYDKGDSKGRVVDVRLSKLSRGIRSLWSSGVIITKIEEV